MAFASNFGRILSPTFQPNSQAKKAGDWWLAGGIDPDDCIAAYQPKGAASYAASKTDLTDNGYDIDGGSAPDWDASYGWNFNGTSHYLLASEFPINNGDFTVAAFIKPLINHNTCSAIAAANPMVSTSRNKGWAFKAEGWNNTGKLGYTVIAKADYTSTIATPSTDSVVICTKSGTSVNIYCGESSSAFTTSVQNDIVNKGLLIGFVYKDDSIPIDLYKQYIYAIAVYNTVLTAEQRAALTTAMNDL